MRSGMTWSFSWVLKACSGAPQHVCGERMLCWERQRINNALLIQKELEAAFEDVQNHLGLGAHPSNAIIQKAKAGGPRVRCQPALHNKTLSSKTKIKQTEPESTQDPIAVAFNKKHSSQSQFSTPTLSSQPITVQHAHSAHTANHCLSAASQLKLRIPTGRLSGS